jgi:ribonuclease HII
MREASVPGKAPQRRGAIPATNGPRTAGGGRTGPDLSHERKLWRAGHQVIAGMDEVGKGAWAGPLTVGVAVMTRGVRKIPNGLRDSKQVPEATREKIFTPVGKWCAAWGVGHSSPQECDEMGMTKALRLAARRAFACLPLEAFPTAIVLDGKFDFVSRRGDPELPFGEITEDPELDLSHVCLPDGSCPEVKTVVKGDDRCASVAAASVLAKVSRDRLMRADADCYPPFDFESNKGYPSPSHKVAIKGYGLTAIHRRSWAFVDWLTVEERMVREVPAGSDDSHSEGATSLAL